MNIQMAERPQCWGELDVAMFGLVRSWDGVEAAHPITYGMMIDHDRLWFVASHSQPAVVHPEVEGRSFGQDLWKYDCVELFLCDKRSGRYVEFNLAANGAWWSAEFKSARRRVNYTEKPYPGVEVFADTLQGGGWLAAMAIPLQRLRGQFDLGEQTTMNVAAISESPQQVFYSANQLPGAQPDFHQPEAFSALRLYRTEDLPEAFQ